MDNAQTAAHTLLWFRPVSPLNYRLPQALLQSPWASTQHIPIDMLRPNAVSVQDSRHLSDVPTWLLSSPTAAHLAAKLGHPSTIAVMGQPSQAAWRAAGGAEPLQWLISPTGESMGLYPDLSKHARVAVLRGQQGRHELIVALRAASIHVTTLAVYEKTPHPQFVRDLNIHLSAGSAALYLSSTDQPARVLAACRDTSLCLQCPVLVSHDRIAQAAQSLGFLNVKMIESY